VADAETVDAEILIGIEHELAAGDGEAYRRHLRDDAVVIVPAQVLDKESTVSAVAESPGWDEFSIDDETVVLLAEASALVTYRFRGRRGETAYAAFLSSAYVRAESGEWKLAFHQHTPIEATP
jgi:hypothetical protein